MKSILKVAAITVALLATTVLVYWTLSSRRAPISADGVLTINRIQALSALTTLRVEVADAQVTEVQGRTGSIKAVLVIRGDVTIGVDLSAARFESVDQRAQTAVLVLPNPKVQTARLDHERTKLIGVWPTGLWTIVPGGEEADTATINMAYRDAERAVSGAANDPAMIERSRQQAEQVLRAFFEALGWTVNFQWRS